MSENSPGGDGPGRSAWWQHRWLNRIEVCRTSRLDGRGVLRRVRLSLRGGSCLQVAATARIDAMDIVLHGAGNRVEIGAHTHCNGAYQLFPIVDGEAAPPEVR